MKREKSVESPGKAQTLAAEILALQGKLQNAEQFGYEEKARLLRSEIERILKELEQLESEHS